MRQTRGEEEQTEVNSQPDGNELINGRPVPDYYHSESALLPINCRQIPIKLQLFFRNDMSVGLDEYDCRGNR
jgi:hypothetical protein